jgi:hypothetical protein
MNDCQSEPPLIVSSNVNQRLEALLGNQDASSSRAAPGENALTQISLTVTGLIDTPCISSSINRVSVSPVDSQVVVDVQVLRKLSTYSGAWVIVRNGDRRCTAQAIAAQAIYPNGHSPGSINHLDENGQSAGCFTALTSPLLAFNLGIDLYLDPFLFPHLSSHGSVFSNTESKKADTQQYHISLHPFPQASGSGDFKIFKCPSLHLHSLGSQLDLLAARSIRMMKVGHPKNDLFKVHSSYSPVGSGGDKRALHASDGPVGQETNRGGSVQMPSSDIQADEGNVDSTSSAQHVYNALEKYFTCTPR